MGNIHIAYALLSFFVIIFYFDEQYTETKSGIISDSIIFIYYLYMHLHLFLDYVCIYLFKGIVIDYGKDLFSFFYELLPPLFYLSFSQTE